MTEQGKGAVKATDSVNVTFVPHVPCQKITLCACVQIFPRPVGFFDEFN